MQTVLSNLAYTFNRFEAAAVRYHVTNQSIIMSLTATIDGSYEE